MTTMMKAVRIHEFGDPGVLKYEDAPVPQPAEGEVLIRVHAAGVNPVDWKTRSGRGMAKRLEATFPLILGWDVSGVIEEIGAGVTQFKPGDEVFGLVRFPQLGAAYAEYTAVPASHLAFKPRTLDHVQAAALPLVSLTAWQALFEGAQLEAGQRVLIHAAAGGVGHIAVQLARWRGAYVIGTTSSRNVLFVRQLGASEVIDYETASFEQYVSEVDAVLDPLAGEVRERSWQVLKKGGVLVSILGEPAAGAAAAYGVRAVYVLVRPEASQLAQIAALVDEGHVRPEIDAVYPLQEAASAHERVERGHTRGKVVLKVS